MENVFVISRTVKQTVVFCRDDFESKKEWESFKKRLASNSDELDAAFYENLDDTSGEEELTGLVYAEEPYEDHFSI